MIILNIFIYFFTLLCALVIVLQPKDVPFFSALNSIFTYIYLKFYFIFFILNLCGVPPFSNFFLKFAMFSNLSKTQSAVIIIFFLINFAGIYFYFQNIKYFKKAENVTSKKSSSFKL